MTPRTTVFFPLALAVGLAGCEPTGALSPTGPSAVVRQPAPAPAGRATFPPGVLSDYTLSGVVFEITLTGQTPIEGAEVYCELCGAETHSWSLTDANGVYRFTGVWTTTGVSTPVWFGKDGYTDPPGVPVMFNQAGWRHVIIDGDTSFNVELVRQ